MGSWCHPAKNPGVPRRPAAPRRPSRRICRRLSPLPSRPRPHGAPSPSHPPPRRAAVYDGLFGGYAVYSHSVCTRLHPLRTIAERAARDGRRVTVASSWNDAKPVLLDLTDGAPATPPPPLPLLQRGREIPQRKGRGSVFPFRFRLAPTRPSRRICLLHLNITAKAVSRVHHGSTGNVAVGSEQPNISCRPVPLPGDGIGRLPPPLSPVVCRIGVSDRRAHPLRPFGGGRRRDPPLDGGVRPPPDHRHAPPPPTAPAVGSM